ncbi:MAG: hypothetical protein P9X22_02910 [Candidatus Zapsychrus exili]|nr:hypothetical protein [Candidatus Zapsychrus exili]
MRTLLSQRHGLIVQGVPAEVDNSESGAFTHTLDKKYKDNKKIPAIVVTQQAKDFPMPAYWHSQLSINSDSNLIRFGHQYLSIHFLKKNDSKYDTFSDTLEPVIVDTLNTWADIISDRRGVLPVNMIGFGYINTFVDFALDGFDLSKYFRYSFGVDNSEIEASLSAVKTSFTILENKTSIPIILEIEVGPNPKKPGFMKVVTKVMAQRLKTTHIPQKDTKKIMEEIKGMKDLAADTFFGFVTDETKKIMEAQYAK